MIELAPKKIELDLTKLSPSVLETIRNALVQEVEWCDLGFAQKHNKLVDIVNKIGEMLIDLNGEAIDNHPLQKWFAVVENGK